MFTDQLTEIYEYDIVLTNCVDYNIWQATFLKFLVQTLFVSSVNNASYPEKYPFNSTGCHRSKFHYCQRCSTQILNYTPNFNLKNKNRKEIKSLRKYAQLENYSRYK